MSALNEYVSDERLWDAIEDVSHWMNNDGADVIPPVIKEKIITLIASTRRNERLCSIKMGTAGKGGVVKVYLIHWILRMLRQFFRILISLDRRCRKNIS